MSLDKDIEQFFGEGNLTPKSKIKAANAFKELVKLLNKGEVRSAEKRDNAWHANEWVKKGVIPTGCVGVAAIHFLHAGFDISFSEANAA